MKYGLNALGKNQTKTKLKNLISTKSLISLNFRDILIKTLTLRLW